MYKVFLSFLAALLLASPVFADVGSGLGSQPSATGSGGVTSITAGSGISVNQSTGAVTITSIAGGGSVTSFSAGNLSPLFTTSVATATSTPVLSFALSNAGAHTYLGNNTGSSTAPSFLTNTQLTADLNVFTSLLQGVVPASGGGTTNFLRADGSWAAPAGGGSPGGTSGQIQYNNAGAFGGFTASGDATINTGTGAVTIANNAVTNAKSAQMAAHTYKGNNTGSTANAADITNTQLTADLNLFTTSLRGLTPASGGGTTNFLRADGNWAAPAGGGGMTNPMTTTGDTIYSSSGSTPARLGIGTAFSRMRTNAAATAPEWKAPNFRFLANLDENNISKFWMFFPFNTGTSLQSNNGFICNLQGTATAVHENNDDFVQCVSAATSGSQAGTYESGTRAPAMDSGPRGQVKIKTGSVITVATIISGLSLQNNTTLANNTFQIMYDSATNSGKWYAACRDGSTTATVDLGVTVAPDTVYILGWDYSNPSKIDFYINGSYKASLNTNLPTGTTNNQFQIRIITNENVAKTIKISGGYIEWGL